MAQAVGTVSAMDAPRHARRARRGTGAGRPSRAPRAAPGPRGVFRRDLRTFARRSHRAPRRARVRSAVRAPGRGDRPVARGNQRRGRDRHRVGQITLLPGTDPRVGRVRPARHRAARLPHQGAGPGPAALAALVARPRPACGHLRRRHRRRRPRMGAQERQRVADQPRDAAHGNPPVAQALGDVPHAAALRRRRRAAHAARHLREPGRARAAPAATPLRALRRVAYVLLRERDDRQSR